MRIIEETEPNAFKQTHGLPYTYRKRTETNSGTTSSSADLTVTFANKFAATPAIGINFSATTSGDYYTLVSSSTTAFTISIYNANNQRQARAFSWTATGYGKKF